MYFHKENTAGEIEWDLTFRIWLDVRFFMGLNNRLKSWQMIYFYQCWLHTSLLPLLGLLWMLLIFHAPSFFIFHTQLFSLFLPYFQLSFFFPVFPALCSSPPPVTASLSSSPASDHTALLLAIRSYGLWLVSWQRYSRGWDKAVTSLAGEDEMNTFTVSEGRLSQEEEEKGGGGGSCPWVPGPHN